MTIPHSSGIDYNIINISNNISNSNNIEKQVSSAYLNTNMNVFGGTTDVIGNTNKYTLIHETSSILNLATGKFVIPKSGSYLISFQIWEQLVNGGNRVLIIRNNNNNIAMSNVENFSTSTAKRFTNHTSYVDYFNLGDEISFHYESNGGINSVYGHVSNKFTWVSLVEL